MQESTNASFDFLGTSVEREHDKDHSDRCCQKAIQLPLPVAASEAFNQTLPYTITNHVSNTGGNESNAFVSNFCGFCQRLFDSWPERIPCLGSYFRFQHHSTKEALELSAEKGCGLCTQLLLGCSSLYERVNQVTKGAEHGYGTLSPTTMDFDRNVDWDDPSWKIWLYIPDDVVDLESQYTGPVRWSFRVYLRPESKSGACIIVWRSLASAIISISDHAINSLKYQLLPQRFISTVQIPGMLCQPSSTG
jgi:hypothetical protein